MRVKAFAALILPLLNAFGIPLVSADVDKFIDALGVVLFGVFEVWGWMRMMYNKKYGLGAYKK